MKISQSIVGLSSSYMLEQEDTTTRKKTSSRTTTARTLSSKRNGTASATDDALPRMVVDRVSISGAAIKETCTEYSHSLSSQSSVCSGDENKTADFSQQEMVEKLVSTLVSEQVSATSLTASGAVQQFGTNTFSSEQASGQIRSAKTTITLDRTTSHFEQEQMTFASRGQVLTQDGRAINFSLELAMDRTTLTETREAALISTWQEEVALIDPLIINLEGGVPALNDTRFEFDLNNDGITEEISFAASGSGFLSFDKNNDGIINNGSELFGPGTGNGFDELAAYDLDGNGWIDENDDVFSRLSVWTRDDTGNDVLVSLAEAGIGAVYLDNASTGFHLTDGDNTLAGEVARSGLFLFENGNVGIIQQIDLAAQSTQAQQESDNQTDLSQSFNAAQVGAGTIEAEVSRPMAQQPWQSEAKTLLEEMRQQIRDMEKQIRRLLNLESKPGNRLGHTNCLFNRIRLPDRELTHRTGRVS